MQPKTPVTPQSTGSKTIFVGNLPYSVEKLMCKCRFLDSGALFSCIKNSQISFCRENFFQAAGEIQDVRLAFDADERFKGFCHVEFTTAEAAQKVICHLDRPNYL